MREKLLAIILLCCSAVSFAATANTTKPSAVDEVYTQDKSNIIVEQRHPTFVIKLKSNPTTGYMWFLREYNSKLMTPVSHRFEGADTKLAGAPGFELWTFRMKPEAFTVPQQTQIRLVYARPWAAMENTTQTVFRISTTRK